MTWRFALAANLTIMVAYLFIAAAILRGLLRTGQVRTNRLGLATAAIFFSCGMGHGEHALHLLGPTLGVIDAEGGAMRMAYDWHLTLVDVTTAFVGAYYWSLRKSYAAVVHGPALFDDLKARQRQALEINDNVVQGLTVARYAMEVGDTERAQAAIDSTLTSARTIISDLVGTDGGVIQLRAGDLTRTQAAAVDGP